jgi:hypothetical protein
VALDRIVESANVTHSTAQSTGFASWLVAATIIIVISIATLFGGFESSAWIRMTTPETVMAVNSLAGYSGFIDERAIHTENVVFFGHVVMFSGGPIAQDFYALRPIYSFFASALVPLFGWWPSMLVVNLAAWACAVLLTFVLSASMTGSSVAARWSALYAAGGLGFVAHVHDYSAHLLAFTFYFGAVTLLYLSGVWNERKGWTTHVAIGCYLAIAALQYNTGLVAVLAYAIVAVRHNGVVRVTVTCVGPYLVVKAWPYLMNLSSGWAIDYELTERMYRGQAMQQWQQLLTDPARLVSRYLGGLVDFMSYEMPFLTLAGLLGVVILCMRRRSVDFTIFIFGCFVAPIMALTAYVGRGLATGYITFQTACFIYVGAGVVLSVYAEKGTMRYLAVAAGAVLLACQLAWNLAFLWGMNGPVQIYFLGLARLWTWLPDITTIPEVLSLTGHDAVPTLFHGDASLAAAGGVACRDLMPTAVPVMSRGTVGALILRLPFALLCAAALGFLMRARLLPTGRYIGARGVAFSTAALLMFPAVVNIPMRADSFPALCYDRRFPARAQTIELALDVSPVFVEKLQALPADVVDIEIFQGFRLLRLGSAQIRTTLFIGDTELPLTSATLLDQIDRATVANAFATSRRVVLRAENLPPDALIEGWQRNGVPGRTLTTDRAITPDVDKVLPMLEIRARRSRGSQVLLFAGF